MDGDFHRIFHVIVMAPRKILFEQGDAMDADIAVQHRDADFFQLRAFAVAGKARYAGNAGARV